MAKTNNIVFMIVQIICWIIFVGLCIEAGALITNFIFSILKPEMIPNLYQKLDLSLLSNQNKWAFYCVYSFILTISILKAILFYFVIDLTLKLDLEKPFNGFVSKKINQISNTTFSIGLVSFIASKTVFHLEDYGFKISQIEIFYDDSQAFIMMSAVVYIISIIFKKGLELQIENELTV